MAAALRPVGLLDCLAVSVGESTAADNLEVSKDSKRGRRAGGRRSGCLGPAYGLEPEGKRAGRQIHFDLQARALSRGLEPIRRGAKRRPLRRPPALVRGAKHSVPLRFFEFFETSRLSAVPNPCVLAAHGTG